MKSDGCNMSTECKEMDFWNCYKVTDHMGQGTGEELRRDCWTHEIRMRADKWSFSLTAKW
jgi:hypothetical protein